ncbi:MAG: hypothetical protein ACXWKR_04715 [Phenylobacterium sp.]
MSRASLAISALTGAAVLASAAGPALAGEARCWFENSVVVVSAEVMGVPGDYILDTATPHTILADSQAQTAGYAETALNGEIRLAGVTISHRPVQVLAIDLRTGALPTPIAGVIGADVLRGFVLDVSFEPCRVALRPKARGRFAARTKLPMDWLADRPVVRAAVADGPDAVSGAFAVAIGADTAIRLSDGLAKAQTARGAVAAKPKELYPYGILRPKLRALSFAGRLSENLPAGLIAAEDPALTGQIGAPVLAGYRLRFDFPRGELLLAPASVGKVPRQGVAHGR